MSGKHKKKRQKQKMILPRPDDAPDEHPEVIKQYPQTHNDLAATGPEQPRGLMLRIKEHGIGLLGLLVALAALLVYTLQWRAMVDTVTITRRVSERDERAWIKAIPGKFATPVVDHLLQWPVQIQNIGRTPARDVVGYFYLEVVSNGAEPDLDYNKLRPIMRAFHGIVYPQDASPDVLVSRMHYRLGSNTDVEEYKLQEAELESLSAGKAYIALHGIVHYEDIFHVKHWTKFCTWNGLTANIAVSAGECALNGNTADDSDEP